MQWAAIPFSLGFGKAAVAAVNANRANKNYLSQLDTSHTHSNISQLFPQQHLKALEHFKLLDLTQIPCNC